MTDSDVLTTITFDKQGDYLAVGDKGGRVIIFHYMQLKNSRYFDYRYFAEIQSHEPEFDHLKSIDLDERVNAMEFLHRSKGDSLKFLSTNDRNIKLWKVVNRVQRDPSYCTIDDGMLRLPNAPVVGSGMEGKCRMEFKHCHLYNINSLSVSPDGENFISADDLRVNLCNLENNKTAYNVVDLKPSNIESLSEVITSLEYHPQRSDVFLFSSSKGYISLCDMRISSQFERAHNRF